MSSPIPGNASGTARLLLGAPSYAVGWQEPVSLAKPAAGAGFTYKANYGNFERVVAVSFQLVTSVVVANRFAQLLLNDQNGVTVTSVPCAGTIVASSTVNVNLVIRAPSYANGASGGVFGFIPDLLIPPGWSWVMALFGADAGDQVSSVVVLTQRFPNDTASITVG